MSVLTISAPQRLVLNGIDWRTYTRLLRAFDERPAIRLTYDRGVLEIMTVSYEHETDAHLLGRLVIVLTEESGLPVNGGGSTTLRRRKRKRGLESDQCFWITNEPLVRGKTKIDLRHDPPPDLALEVEVTRRALNRLPIYADLGIPEIWRLEAQHIHCHLLGADGKYTESTHSRAFPWLAPADLGPFLALRGQMDQNAIVRQFRVWVRQQLAGGGASPPP